ncbi:hypothetical protein D3C71_1781450 [compost metagenome]
MTYIRVAQTERLALRDKVGELAVIALGHHEGRWFFALSHQQRTGDMWGSFGGIGYQKGEPRAASRDEALAAAIALARQRWAKRTREMAAHIAWLDTLIPEQPDLFGAAA